ncbi:MAG: MFS transporter [Halothiobacillaceae bacterium]
MIQVVTAIRSLLLGMGILLAGSGLLGTLLGLRAGEEGFPQWVTGIVMSAFFVGYIIGSWLCPKIIHRVGHIRTFAVMATISSVVALLHGMVVDPYAWWWLRVLNGISLLGLYMVIESWLNETVIDQRGQIFGIYMTISLLALGAGQFLILLYGPMDLASFALVAILFSLGLLPVALTRRPQPQPIATGALSLVTLYRKAPTGVAGALLSGVVTGAFWGMGAVYAHDLALSPQMVATFIALTILGGALLQWPLGKLSDNRDRRIVMSGISLAGALCAIALLAVQPAADTLLLIVALLYGGFSFSLYAISVAQTHDRLGQGQVLEGTRALLLLNGIGAALGPLLAGGLMQWLGSARGFPLALLMTLMALATFVHWRMQVDKPVPETERGEFVPVTRTSAVAAELDPRTPDPD